MISNLLKPVQRNRIWYFLLTIVTIAIGLASRTSVIPKIIYPDIGDLFYALMIYFMVGFVFKTASPIKVSVLSISVCFAIELSQLYQSDRINEIRNTKLGGLILGFGFLWSDLISYTLGVILGLRLEKFLIQKEATIIRA